MLFYISPCLNKRKSLRMKTNHCFNFWPCLHDFINLPHRTYLNSPTFKEFLFIYMLIILKEFISWVQIELSFSSRICQELYNPFDDCYVSICFLQNHFFFNDLVLYLIRARLIRLMEGISFQMNGPQNYESEIFNSSSVLNFF